MTAIMAKTRGIAGTIVEAWLRTRDCAVPVDSDLRYLPASERYPWPAMVGIVTDFLTGERMSLHFTYLSLDGRSKAPVEKQRALLFNHEKRGGVIRLTADADVERHLGLGEGIESCLAVTKGLGRQAHWLPVWATIDAGNMASLPVAAGIERLTVFADTDAKRLVWRNGSKVEIGEEGQRAARTLARRWHEAGCAVYIGQAPAGPDGKADWNAPGEAA
jgi:hypothetical protein